MTSRPLLAFDIETIPDPDVGRRLWGFQGDDASVVRAMVERRLEETEGRSAYPQLPHHRVVTIGVAAFDPQRKWFKVSGVGGAALDERSHVTGFFRLIEQAPVAPRLISWNGAGFDLPVLRYRSMLLGLSVPALYRSDGEWKWNNYQSRYQDMHVDLMDVLSGYGASHRVGLGTLSELLGLPGKSFLEGEVWEHAVAGEDELINEYCKMDVVLTLLIYLVWTFHCGRLSAEELRTRVTTIRTRLESESFGGWRSVVDALEGWPAWL